MFQKIIITFLIFLLLASCEKVIQLDLPFEKEEVVLFGEISLSDGIKVNLSKMANPTQKLNFALPYKDIKVILLKNGVVIDTLDRVSNTFSYISKHSIEISSKYAVQIYGDNEIVAESDYQFPIPKAAFVAVQFQKEEIGGLNYNSKAKILEVKLTDNDNNKNYYAIFFNAYSSGIKSTVTRFVLGTQTQDIKDNCGFYSPTLDYFFSDNCFDENNQFIFLQGVENLGYDRIKREDIEPDSIVVTIKKFNSYYYDYYATIREPNLLENGFSSPVALKSNLLKGVGVWSAVETEKTVIKGR